MRNITNTDCDTNVYINTNLTATLPLEESQSSFNNPIVISLKGITGFTGSAGNVLKSNSTNNALEWADDAGSNWTLSGTNLYPLSISTNILIGTTTNTNGYGVYVLDKNIAIKTSAGSGSSQGLRIINDGYSVLNYLDNNGDMFWAGGQNDYNFDKKLIINTSGSANELSNGTYNYTLPTTGSGTLALTTDIPTPTTQFWSLTGSLLEPVSTYNLQIDGVIKIGTSTENYILQTDDTDHTFQIKEQDGTNVFKYDSDNGYVDFGTIAGSRMNFGYYTLTGTDTDYPSGVSMPFGTISSIYGASAFIRSITTDDLILSEYGASPATITTTLRCNAGGDVAFTRGANFSNQVVINTGTGLGLELSNGNYEYSFPNLDGTLALFSQIPTDNTQLINGAGFITQASTDTLTNKTIISFTANAGAIITTPSSTGTLALVSDIPSVSGFITASSTDTLTNKTWNSSKITEIYGGTNQNSYTTGDILYASATNTLSKLLIGSTDQVLTVIAGVPSWENTATPDLTTAENFGTAVITGNNIKLGNSSGSGYSSNLELFFSSTLKFFNTSNVNVATFTVSSSWVNLDLKGGTITNATIGSNGIWNGGAIEYNYGGTGLSTLTPNKILQINSSGNGYDMIDLPISNTYTAGTDISISALNVISYVGSAGGSNWTILGVGVNPYLTPLNSGYRWIKLTSIGCDITGSLSTVSASTFNISSPTFLTSNSTIRFNALSTLEITHGSSSSRKFYVNSGGCEITGDLDMLGTGIVKTNYIRGKNNTGNRIETGSYGWNIHSGSYPDYQLALRNDNYSTSIYPFIGNTSGGFRIHINGVGDVLNINTSRKAIFNGQVEVQGSMFYSNSLSPQNSMGFSYYLPGYSPTYAVLTTPRFYGYFASSVPVFGTSGGSYDGYWGGGGIGNASDRNLKTNITTIKNPIDIIKKLRGVNFEWICDNKPKGVQIGYIAQELNEVLPSLCDFDPEMINDCCPDGTWGIRPTLISSILVEGIKEQQIEIDTLKTEIDTLKTELDTVKTELDTYKSLMDKLIIAPSFKSFKESIA
jgi:hypothetical protein